jgi:ABC-2 type transport system ATP-binding protein
MKETCMTSTHESVIETDHLSKVFNGVQALDGLDLRVPKNSIFGFLGPNGAGKSTTIKLLLGLLNPTSGGGRIFGLDIRKDGPEIRSRIGYLAQNPSFFPSMTARETLRFVARFFYRGPKFEIEKRIRETLELVGLAEKADRAIGGFSGGEKQRLGIAQAQINHPDLLILDEPAASLDPQGRHDVLEIMESLRENATIFFSTHILDDVQKVSDTVAILNQGKLVTQAPIEELLLGSGSSMYSIITRGIDVDIQKQISDVPWISSINPERLDGNTHWQVVVNDDEMAQKRLLRLILEDPTITVIEFGKKKYELEEVFLQIVEDSNHENHD